MQAKTRQFADLAVTTSKILDANITTGKLDADAVDGYKIADNAVQNEHFQDYAVDTTALDAASVDTANINNEAVTVDKLASGAVTETKFANSAVTNTKIGAAAINGDKLADNSVNTSELAADSIDGSKITDDAVNTEHFASGAVDADALGADAVNGSKIADGAIGTEHLSPLGVDATAIATGAIIEAKLDADVVDSTKIGDDQIDSEHFVDTSIDGSHLSTDAKDEVMEYKLLVARAKESDISCPNQNLMALSLDFEGLDESYMETSGSSSFENVIFDSPNNHCRLLDADTNEPIEDGNNRDVYGRFTVAKLTLTGIVDFGTGTTVLGFGTSFLSQVVAGDYLAHFETGVLYEVASVNSDVNITLVNSATNTDEYGTCDRYRGILSFYVDVNGVETAHTMAGTEVIDVYYSVSKQLKNLPFSALTTGIAFADGLPGGHSQQLSDFTDITATEAEVDQVCDGVSANVTSTNLNTLTGTGDAGSAIHHHNGQYYTESELGATGVGTSGAGLIGYDDTAVSFTADDVQEALDDLDAAAGSVEDTKMFHEQLTVTALNTVSDLSYTPSKNTSTKIYVEGMEQDYSTDYTVSGKSVSWGSGDFDLEVGDIITATYPTSDTITT